VGPLEASVVGHLIAVPILLLLVILYRVRSMGSMATWALKNSTLRSMIDGWKRAGLS
jgi:thiosulfate reductase cytochrome b subunit